ncbi:MAG: hypothetical protein U9N62_13530 [Thermotogota bacterium]|nr:hypothetical protein [Thermotogota bacterium]
MSGQNPAPYLPAEGEDNDFDINSFFQKIEETDGILRSKMIIILINSNIKEITKTEELSSVWKSLRRKSIFIINHKTNGMDKLVSTFDDLVEEKNIFEIDLEK